MIGAGVCENNLFWSNHQEQWNQMYFWQTPLEYFFWCHFYDDLKQISSAGPNTSDPSAVGDSCPRDQNPNCKSFKEEGWCTGSPEHQSFMKALCQTSCCGLLWNHSEHAQTSTSLKNITCTNSLSALKIWMRMHCWTTIVNTTILITSPANNITRGFL